MEAIKWKMAVGRLRYCLLFAFLFVLGSCNHSHVHDMTLTNDVGKFTCQPGRLFKGAVPKGIATISVDHLKALGTAVSAEECLKLCCNQGQDKCQYLWVFGEACFSVACEHASISCLPQLLSKNVKMDSVYLKMQYVVKDKDLGDFEDMLDGHLGDKDKDIEQGHPPPPPPVADAGADVVVMLPVDVVHIYGNGSKVNQGTTYHWQLISEHFVHPLLENPDSPILQVKNLIAGNYTFRLTVTDPSDRSSSATVVVHVLPETRNIETTTTMPASSQTTVVSSDEIVPTGTNESHVGVAGDEADSIVEDKNEAYNRKRRIVLKIVVPVLLSVASILTLSAFIVGLSACLCERNRRRMKRFYRYKRLPETIEKT